MAGTYKIICLINNYEYAGKQIRLDKHYLSPLLKKEVE